MSAAPVILVVDDSPVNLAVVQTFIEGVYKEPRVLCATSPQRALELAAAETPSIVITDHRLGDAMSGVDLCRALRAKYGSKLTLILSSAQNEPDFAKVADAVLPKPISISALDQLILKRLPKLTRAPPRPAATPRPDTDNVEFGTALARVEVRVFRRLEEYAVTLQQLSSQVGALERVMSAHALEADVLCDPSGSPNKSVSAPATDSGRAVLASLRAIIDTQVADLGASQHRFLERASAETLEAVTRAEGRIGQLELKSAQAIEQIGEQVTRMGGRYNERLSALADQLEEASSRTNERLQGAENEAREALSGVRELAQRDDALISLGTALRALATKVADLELTQERTPVSRSAPSAAGSASEAEIAELKEAVAKLSWQVSVATQMWRSLAPSGAKISYQRVARGIWVGAAFLVVLAILIWGLAG